MDSSDSDDGKAKSPVLDKTKSDDDSSSDDSEDEPAAAGPGGLPLFSVEKVKGMRGKVPNREFHIKWENYPESENSWEPECGVIHLEIVQEYIAKCDARQQADRQDAKREQERKQQQRKHLEEQQKKRDREIAASKLAKKEAEAKQRVKTVEKNHIKKEDKSGSMKNLFEKIDQKWKQEFSKDTTKSSESAKPKDAVIKVEKPDVKKVQPPKIVPDKKPEISKSKAAAIFFQPPNVKKTENFGKNHISPSNSSATVKTEKNLIKREESSEVESPPSKKLENIKLEKEFRRSDSTKSESSGPEEIKKKKKLTLKIPSKHHKEPIVSPIILEKSVSPQKVTSRETSLEGKNDSSNSDEKLSRNGRKESTSSIVMENSPVLIESDGWTMEKPEMPSPEIQTHKRPLVRVEVIPKNVILQDTDSSPSDSSSSDDQEKRSKQKEERDDWHYNSDGKLVNDDGEEVFEIRRILSDRYSRVNRGQEYLVQWEGYGSDADTWEPEDNLSHLDVFTEYHDKKAKRAKKLTKKAEKDAIRRKVSFKPSTSRKDVSSSDEDERTPPKKIKVIPPDKSTKVEKISSKPVEKVPQYSAVEDMFKKLHEAKEKKLTKMDRIFGSRDHEPEMTEEERKKQQIMSKKIPRLEKPSGSCSDLVPSTSKTISDSRRTLLPSPIITPLNGSNMVIYFTEKNGILNFMREEDVKLFKLLMNAIPPRLYYTQRTPQINDVLPLTIPDLPPADPYRFDTLHKRVDYLLLNPFERDKHPEPPLASPANGRIESAYRNRLLASALRRHGNECIPSYADHFRRNVYPRYLETLKKDPLLMGNDANLMLKFRFKNREVEKFLEDRDGVKKKKVYGGRRAVKHVQRPIRRDDA